MQKDNRRKCVICRGRFDDDEIAVWVKKREDFQMIPLMCPSCYEWFRKADIVEQASTLLN